jgi:high-affinity iron transporter
MWVGVVAAFAIAGGLGLALHLWIGEISGDARWRAFAAVMLLAVVVLTWMIFWMRRHAASIRGELQDSMARAVSGRGNVTVAVVAAAFLAVLREGFEAAVFLLALATDDGGGGVLLGALLGVTVAAFLAYLVVVAGRRLPMRQFFTVTGLMLIVFAAGLLARAVGLLQTTDDLPLTWDAVYDLTAYSFLTQDTETGRFLIAIAGWDPRPSIEQVLLWFGYVAVVGTLFLRRPAPRRQRVSQAA